MILSSHTNLHMRQQLCCHGMCKIVTWSDQYHIHKCKTHYNDVIMGVMASQITSLTIVYSTLYSGADYRKHQSSASLAFVRGMNRLPVNLPHKWPVTQKMFPFDEAIMIFLQYVDYVFINYLYVPIVHKHYPGIFLIPCNYCKTQNFKYPQKYYQTSCNKFQHIIRPE